jgi:hypothetical protein
VIVYGLDIAREIRFAVLACVPSALHLTGDGEKDAQQVWIVNENSTMRGKGPWRQTDESLTLGLARCELQTDQEVRG